MIKCGATSKICEAVSSCCCTPLHFEDDSTRNLQSHSFTIWWGFDKIPVVELFYNWRRTRQDTWSRTLFQCDENSTRYLQQHPVPICQDSTKYLESRSVTIWGWVDKISGVSLCYNFLRTRQDTCSPNYDSNRILLCLHSKRYQKLWPSDRSNSKTHSQILRNIHTAVNAYLVFQVLMEYKDSLKVFMKTTTSSHPVRVQINPWGKKVKQSRYRPGEAQRVPGS